MKLLFQLILLQSLVLASRDEQGDKSKLRGIPSRCSKRVKHCGPFLPPAAEVGRYDCKFNSRSCTFTCVLKCPRQHKHKLWMFVNNRRQAKEAYVCRKGRWTRRETPRGYCVARMPVQTVRQNFHHVSQLNSLVNTLMESSYLYLGMALFYDRADVALPGFGRVMTSLWQTDMMRSRNTLGYINKRGGYITLFDVPRPTSYEKLLEQMASHPAQIGLQIALGTARSVNQQLLSLHEKATSGNQGDPHMKAYIEQLLPYQVEVIQELVELSTRLASYSDQDYTLGEFALDLSLREYETLTATTKTN